MSGKSLSGVSEYEPQGARARGGGVGPRCDQPGCAGQPSDKEVPDCAEAPGMTGSPPDS